jgi:Peptidase family S41
MKTFGLLSFAILVFLSVPGRASSASFDPSPWVEDLGQARQAFHEKYANWDWAEGERGVKIDALFDDLEQRLRKAPDERAARAVFDRLVRKIGDGHVEIDWPQPHLVTSGDVRRDPDPCSDLGYDARQNGPGTAAALSTYTALPPAGNPIDAGLVDIGSDRLGVVRIGVFQPQGYPQLCHAALHALNIAANRPCDAICEDRVLTWVYVKLTDALEQRIRQLKAAGATAMMVDISNNGGGSEWAEAAVRVFSPKLLVSERIGFVRTQHWVKQWGDLASLLREAANNKHRSAKSRQALLDYAAQAEAAANEARTPCAEASSGCSRVGTAGYSTGFVGAARSNPNHHLEDWEPRIFSPSQYSYEDGLWNGPLLVLVDQETWSAAEEFAAVLQDNKAAIVIGARTGGAGCGYTDGGDPTKLKNTGAILKLPDCVRFREDGSNEVRGIIPDELVAIRADDGARFRARLIEEKLASALARAKALQGAVR